MSSQNDQYQLPESAGIRPSCPRIAVKFTEAAAILSMGTSTFNRLLPELKARGLKQYRDWYLLDSLRQTFEKLCDENSGNMRQGHKIESR